MPIGRIELIQGDTLLTPDQGNDLGQPHHPVGGMQLRQASAAARQALMAEAAKKSRTDQLTVTDGVISGGGKNVSYGELIGGKSFAITLDPKQPVKEKAPKDYKIVGTSQPRVDIPEDHRPLHLHAGLQGARHAARSRGAPAAIGAKLESVDDSALKSIPGIVKVVREGDFLAVVASNDGTRSAAPAAIKATWSKSETLPDQGKLWEHVRATKVVKDEVTSNTGNTAEAMGKDGRQGHQGDLRLRHPHPRLDRPVLRDSRIQGRRTDLWSASQATHALRKQLAQMFSLPAEKVRCVYLEGSGCYGRNGHEDAAADAALLAKAVGKPVRVQWSRADEHGWDPKGPPTLMDMRAEHRCQGNIIAWEGDFYMPQQTADGFLVPLVAATLSGMPAADHIAPGNVSHNSAIQYTIPNVKTVCKRLERRRSVRPGFDAGAHAEHLRQRVLHRRARRDRQHGPARVPPEVSRRQARPRAAQPSGGGSPSGEAAIATEIGERQAPSRDAASHMSNMSWCAPISAPSPRWRWTAAPA